MQEQVWRAPTQVWDALSLYPLEYVRPADAIDLAYLLTAATSTAASPKPLGVWIDAMLHTLHGGAGVLLDGCSLLIRGRSTIIGASVVVLSDQRPWMCYGAVLPAYRRQGIGTALLAATLTALHRAQYHDLYCVVPDAVALASFLAQRGFTAVHRQDYTIPRGE